MENFFRIDLRHIKLFKLLQIKHATTPYHPQCNAQAEVQNKIIAKYLSSFVDSTTLDWPLYMAPMAFAYNTALHRSIKATPFFLTYGIEPRLPALPTPDVRRYYGQSDVAEWFATLQHCRQLATHHNINASDEMQAQFNKKASPYNYVPDQLVYLDVQNFLGRNRKLAPKWMGPYPISKVFDAGVVQLKLNNRQLRVNVSRIKPYISPIPSPNVNHNCSSFLAEMLQTCCGKRTFIINFKLKYCVVKYKEYLDGSLISHVIGTL